MSFIIFPSSPGSQTGSCTAFSPVKSICDCFSRHFLSFITLTSLKKVDQRFCRMALNLGLPSVSPRLDSDCIFLPRSDIRSCSVISGAHDVNLSHYW